MSMTEKEQAAYKKFRTIVSTIVDHFPDYLILVRGPDGGMMWKQADETWSAGAATRYLEFIRDRDRMEMEDISNEEE